MSEIPFTPERISRLRSEISLRFPFHTENLVREMLEEIERLQKWVNDLQSRMFINCVYCGHRYGPDPGTPVAMAELLKQHIEQCPHHPMSALKAENARLRAALESRETP